MQQLRDASVTVEVGLLLELVRPCFGEIFNGGEAFGNSVSPPVSMLEVGRQLQKRLCK